MYGINLKFEDMRKSDWQLATSGNGVASGKSTDKSNQALAVCLQIPERNVQPHIPHIPE